MSDIKISVKYCSTIPTVQHAQPSIYGYNFNESVTYQCDDGFEFPDDGEWNRTIRCQENESWELVATACTSKNLLVSPLRDYVC